MKEPFLNIGKRKIGPGYPALIVAELSCNHLQKFDLAVKTIEAMKKAGVEAVKIQTYTPDTITIDSTRSDFQIKQGTIWDGKNLHKLYEEAYTPWDWQPKLQKIAHKLGMLFFSSPFDKSAVDFLAKMSVPAYKLASFEIRDIPLIRHMAKQGKPMIISTGIAELADIQLAVATCKAAGNHKIALLKCTSAYPAPLKEVNLHTMADMKKRFRTVVGLSDHTLGNVVPTAAIALGASVIEKHFIIDRKLGGPDAPFSMEPDEFKKLVEDIRATELALGKVTYTLGEKANKARAFGRSLYVVANVRKGEKFTATNIRSIRPGYGLHPKFYDQVLGKKAKKNISRGTALRRGMF